jgi:NTP pyrophosphatase (non-canonical NTP hydrolase)
MMAEVTEVERYKKVLEVERAELDRVRQDLKELQDSVLGPDFYTFDQYSTLALRTAAGADLTMAALGLAGEMGEFVEMVKKDRFHAKPIDKERAVKELGDVLWYWNLACKMLDVSPAKVAQENISKLRERYPGGYTDMDFLARRDEAQK